MVQGYISWFTPPVGAQQGFGYAAVNLIEALQRREIVVMYNADEPHTQISWVQPPWYTGHSDQYRIGYTPWESTRVPKGWIYHMNTRDEIWTPSQFCKDIFDSHKNIEGPVTVVPHGINPEHFPIISGNPTSNKFTFFHVGAPTQRKGAQRVFDAFLDLFDGNDDVQLLMKSMGPSDARYIDKYDNMHNVSYHPQVRVFESEASIDVLRGLYSEAWCMVYPSAGEGFGFIPFQAIASGIPTICTNGTALAEFAPLSIPLDFKWTEGEGLHLGEWCEPDMDDLKDKMLHVYNNWDAEKARAIEAANHIHSTQTWDHIADQILKILGNKVH